MTFSEIRNLFDGINVWKRRGERAPNKPLLLLYALARLSQGQKRLLAFVEVDADIGPLLAEFGPKRKLVHPEYPFWYLKNDGIWEIATRLLS